MKREGDGMWNWLIAVALGGLLFWMWLRQDQERMRTAREQAEDALRRAEQATKETGERLRSALDEGRERAEDLVDAGRARATELKSQVDDARADVQRRADEFRQDVQEQAARVRDVAQERIGDLREAVEERIDPDADNTPDTSAPTDAPADPIQAAVTQAEERSEELREKLEDTLRETRLAAPSEETSAVSDEIPLAVDPDVMSRTHSLAEELREKAHAQATETHRDDLARIDGIGDRSAQALYKAGVTTFAQLAALNDDAIRQHLEAAGVQAHNSLPSWREQAARFAQESTDEPSQSDQS